MADSASESDSSSVDGGPIMMPPSPVTREQLQKRIESLQQQNRVLKVELDTYKLRVKSLQEGNRALRQASVTIQVKAEQEEEFISNTLLKKIQALKKEKETLALNYEQEEECLTNDLSRKLNQLRREKVQLEQTLEQEQECLVNKLMRKIEKLEAETVVKQNNLEQLRREKVELENTLEQEQEALVNKLWKRMDKLEAEKRMLQIKLDQPVSAPPSPRDINNGDTAVNLTNHISLLRSEVMKLKTQLSIGQKEHAEKMQRYALEEKQIREENLRLQRKLQLEMERREALCRHLSESESSLEMEEERQYNEMTSHGQPIVRPYNPSPSSSRPLSPGLNYGSGGSRDTFSPPSPLGRCPNCGQTILHPTVTVPVPVSASGSGTITSGMGTGFHPSTSPPPPPVLSTAPGHLQAAGYQRPLARSTQERFVKPVAPPPLPPTGSATVTSLSDTPVPSLENYGPSIPAVTTEATGAMAESSCEIETISGTTSPMDTSKS